MVAPIALYNSEVWGISCLPNNPNNNILFDQDKIYKYPVEGLHGKFVKRVLGVRDTTSNWASFSEVGRSPIIMNVLIGLLKFFAHMQETTSGILLAALKVNIELSDRGFNTWVAYMKRLVSFCNLKWEGLGTENILSFANKSKKFLFE